ncbi:MAG: hypothetical protein KME07_05075 [Pegethrix bostrychoides GSE-TBD4-15B]|jgi:hypothetical protein|uniref:LPXTG cell wall anchor domain-containing protein n=1 Tax=Pegethrix bostrychoides GSE-TBD4-15B TaxID=2839662 RepID=A0A951P850_9CYAN|nr:hypothetical protein [Pegethrix bostrychoides GSE-TBD4-15B]
MKSKVFLSAILSAAALTGVALGTALPSSACSYSNTFKSTSTSIMGDAGTSGNTIDFTAPNKSSLIAAGLAALGLFAGGMVLKARLNKQSAGRTETAAPTAVKEASVFPIEVPAEALAAERERVEENV